MSIPLLDVRDPVRGGLVVADGSSTVILGASGSGKTRWLQWLLGLDRSSRPAEIHLDGRPATVEHLRQHVGWVPQTDAVFLSGTVWDNVRRPPGTRPVPDDDTALDVLDLLGLADRVNDPCDVLGHGQRRRVGLARALAAGCDLLVVDEPLDPTVTAWWEGVLDQAPHGRPRGVLTATAAADDLARSHERVAVLAEGRVLACDSWPAVLQSTDPDVRGVMTWVGAT